jgi:hypothetical protein
MFYHEIVCGWQNSQLQEAAIFGTGFNFIMETLRISLLST